MFQQPSPQPSVRFQQYAHVQASAECRRAGRVLWSACWIAVLGCQMLFGSAWADERHGQGQLTRLKVAQENAVTDLGVGLWAIPLPIDYDGDGDLDLIVSTSNKPSPGVYFFENPGGGKLPVFRPAVRIGEAHANVMLAWNDGQPVVCTPGRWHDDFLNKCLAGGQPLPFKPQFHIGRANQWQLLDYDGDGVRDLIIGVSDWRDYGWDDAYDRTGRWTNGPLHGYVYFVKNLGSNEKPQYDEAVQLQAGDGPLDVYGCPSPNFADWDGDGDLDLVCGSFLDHFTFFENVGTRQQPRYAAGRRLEHNGRPILMDLEMLRVTACDWDGDGDVDLIVGQEDGRVALIECRGFDRKRGQPDFLPPVFFRQKADDLKAGVLNTPSAVDWDGDGDLDLICGDSAGYLHFVENVGRLNADGTPRFALPQLLEADGQVIRIQAGENGSIQGPAEAKWGYTVPAAGDFDGDGLPDIVINSIWGEILWYRNIGTRQQPKLAAAQRVEVAWPGAPPKPAWNWWHPRDRSLVTQWRTSPVLFDVNGDGLNDLVILDHEGYLACFERFRDAQGHLSLKPPQRIFGDERGEPLRLNDGRAGKSGRRKLTLTDWDGDGRIDLLLNSINVEFWRNVGTDGQWRFRNLGSVSEQRLAGHTTCPTVGDFDGDGRPDLILDAEDGFFYYLANPWGGRTTKASAAQ